MSRSLTRFLIPVMAMVLALSAFLPAAASGKAPRINLDVTVGTEFKAWDGSSNRSDSHQVNGGQYCEYSVRLKGLTSTGSVAIPAGMTQAGVALSDLGSLTIVEGELNFAVRTIAPATCGTSLMLTLN